MLESINSLASNSFVIGISILLMNIGSRFITHELSADDSEYQQNIVLRRMVVFVACFVGTKDIVTSILLTGAFVVLAGGVFRGKGPFSREGMHNKPKDIRAAAGLGAHVDQPAYNSEEKPLFR